MLKHVFTMVSCVMLNLVVKDEIIYLTFFRLHILKIGAWQCCRLRWIAYCTM